MSTLVSHLGSICLSFFPCLQCKNCWLSINLILINFPQYINIFGTSLSATFVLFVLYYCNICIYHPISVNLLLQLNHQWSKNYSGKILFHIFKIYVNIIIITCKANILPELVFFPSKKYIKCWSTMMSWENQQCISFIHDKSNNSNEFRKGKLGFYSLEGSLTFPLNILEVHNLNYA